MDINEHDEDGAAVSALWKSNAERLALYVSDWLDYQDGMIVRVPPHPTEVH
ncbi:MAG: hypothetical protein SO053_07310 [Bifidobacterium animalis]|nr:hypothetical protein [Bifidobacterium animalis]MDY5040939.1 hypothetical protein [Bifidobacterium animalis]